MCGIVGHFSYDQDIDERHAARMLKSINHRGPDCSGTYIKNNVFIGHNRLSILDLTDAGKQPMWNDDHTVAIVYNGEIYNFSSIRSKLNEFRFQSQTDTEVILYAYQKWGIREALRKFNGMFSFCIYDTKVHKAYFVRDRIGIKPFVYFWDGKDFVFSSELKALLHSPCLQNREIDLFAVIQYFVSRYIGTPRTIFRNTYKLTPGHYLELDLSTFTLNEKIYWKIPAVRHLDMPERQILEQIDDLIHDSIRLRLISDTEVAGFLSGGIDSSLVSSLAHTLNPGLKSFTIDIHPEKYSEYSHALMVARTNGIRLEANLVDKTTYESFSNEIFASFDEPFADSSLIPTWILCRYVHESNIKCALSGDGADELFYGYEWYRKFNGLHNIPDAIRSLLGPVWPLFSHVPKFRHLAYASYDSLERYRRIMFDRFTLDEINLLFGVESSIKETNFLAEKFDNRSVSPSDLNLLDCKTFLVDDILYKVDIASMANSLEVRVPYLDHRLVELLFALRFKLLFKNKQLKYILKEIATPYLPNQIINRKKRGFSAPVMQWINKDFRNELMNGSMIREGFISKKHLNSSINAYSTGKLWQLYVFEKWFSRYAL